MCNVVSLTSANAGVGTAYVHIRVYKHASPLRSQQKKLKLMRYNMCFITRLSQLPSPWHFLLYYPTSVIASASSRNIDQYGFTTRPCSQTHPQSQSCTHCATTHYDHELAPAHRLDQCNICHSGPSRWIYCGILHAVAAKHSYLGTGILFLNRTRYHSWYSAPCGQYSL